MTKEDIITTAIHEAFLCGKEAGEAYERAYHIMQKKVEEAKQGKPDHDLHMYDGIFGMTPNYRVKIDPESALNPDSKEVTFQVQSLPGQRIGDTPEEKITMLEHQCCLLKQENIDLQRQCEEKDATITELRQELEKLHATVPDASTSGGKSSCAHLYDGDQVLVIGAFFGNDVPSYHATILEVTDSMALVLITEKDSDFENDEHYVPYEYITKQ